jgi:hypothetical protein
MQQAPPPMAQEPKRRTAFSLPLIGALTAALLGLSCWLLSVFGGASVLLPSAWGGTSQRTSTLQTPPYIGLEVNYQDGKQRPTNGPDALWIQHRSTRLDERTGQLIVHLENRSATKGHVVFYLSHRALAVEPGERMTLSGTGELRASDKQTEAGIGFHAMNEQGQYLTEVTSDQSMMVTGLDGVQPLQQSYERPGRDGAQTPNVAMLAPRLAIYNIAPSAKVDVTLKWSPASLGPPPATNTLKVEPWPAVSAALPHSIWRFDVFGTGSKSLPSALRESIVLYKDDVLAFESAPRTAQAWRTAGNVRSAWRVMLPESLPQGHYDAKLKLHQGETSYAVHALGSVRISPKAGMWTGMNFHRYPGSAEKAIGPLELNHQVARSFSGDGWNPNVWWRGIDSYGWKGIDAWARFHAPKGEKRLLITFSGTPTWASAAPQQGSGMQLPGYAAPPRKELFPAYGRMVRATIERLQGRVLAVECWNEPDLGEFFTGTSTDMADLCGLVRDNAKSVDPSIAVICPQTTSVRNLALVMAAKTSDGRALPDLCDQLGIHIYGALGDDADGLPYDTYSVARVVRDVQTMMARHGIQKPMAITEYGLVTCEPQPTAAHPVPFARMSNDEAGEALYQSLATLQANGVALVALYSYDEGNNEPGCRPGGSRVRMMEMAGENRQQPNSSLVRRFNQAVRDFGAR